MLKKTLFSFVLILNAFLAIKFFSFSVTQEEPKTDFQKLFAEHYRVFALQLPEKLSFANEQVPLHILDVREKVDRELLVNTYWQSNGLLLHKRANRYFPIIEPILKRNGIPNDFKYLALIESGLENVVSPAGATGFWQLLSATAKERGLEVNSLIDERYNVIKSTEAACSYLKEAKARLGSWTLAAASYNMGMSGISKQLDRQKVNNYYDLLLNSETGRYVYRLVALKEILEHSRKYGFYYNPEDLYPPFKTKVLSVDTSVTDLAAFANDKGYNYKILKLLNPWLRDSQLVNKSGKKYLIELPLNQQEGLVIYKAGEFAPLDSTVTN